ncbi:dsRBD fold-containing protein [Streptomyces sp. NPDC059506]|uniref:DUF1876 domain-containing protein n=1 Tax=Streptomyces thermolineatus TaxID=44033 RepID=A0ABP5Z9K4_9ACTN|nr:MULTISPECIES: dsRBD fold-containing protein [unclassified Streptomyces]MCZ2526375.1 DUF1876 family protein [Streptomyces sp. HB2AG]QMV24532.1 DUF1876 domain-containing protein [Streptomyces sp. SCUT-3]
MSDDTGAFEAHVKEWTVRIHLFEEGSLTRARAVLDTGDNVIEGLGEARRNPHDPSVPEIGDEFAVGRALADLGLHLIHSGRADSAAVESVRRRDTG